MQWGSDIHWSSSCHLVKPWMLLLMISICSCIVNYLSRMMAWWKVSQMQLWWQQLPLQLQLLLPPWWCHHQWVALQRAAATHSNQSEGDHQYPRELIPLPSSMPIPPISGHWYNNSQAVLLLPPPFHYSIRDLSPWISNKVPNNTIFTNMTQLLDQSSWPHLDPITKLIK